MTLGHNSAGKDLRTRYLYLGIAIFLGLCALAVRLYRLQITRGDEYAQKSEANYIKEVRVKADRGMIKDRRGDVLVTSRPSFDVFITPAFCDKCADEVLPKLAMWLGWDEPQRTHVEQLVRQGMRRQKFEAVPVQLDLNRDELDTLDAHRAELPWAVDWHGVPHRAYPIGTVLSHLLGYMNEISQDELDERNAAGANYALGDFVGRRGIERFFEPQLRGSDGSRKEVVNAKGEMDPELTKSFADKTVASTPGDNVVLSIDIRLQEAAEKAFPGVAGAVVAVDVRTGFILAMVSRPGFDSNLLTGRVTPAQLAAMSKDPLQPMIFRPVQQHYSPGSTFKPITALAAMKSGVLGPQTGVLCTGGYQLGGRRWRCDKEAGHGTIDMRAALQHSCDVYFYRAADLMGLDPIAEEAREFGLGQRTGIGVVAEVPGIMPTSAYHDRATPGGYNKGFALNSSIGQGDVNVTPLQLAMVYSTLANGGTLYRPQLVRRLESLDGHTVKEYQPEVVRHVDMTPEDRRIIVDALTAVVNEPGGTGYASRLPNIKFAGKTGTAQVVKIGKVRLKANQVTYWQRDHAWFASFAPAEDPEIAVIVLNEHSGFGATGAAPTAAAVIKRYFELKADDSGHAAAALELPAAHEVVPPPPIDLLSVPMDPATGPAPPPRQSGRSLAQGSH